MRSRVSLLRFFMPRARNSRSRVRNSLFAERPPGVIMVSANGMEASAVYRKSTAADCERVYALICDMENRALPLDRFREIYLGQLGSDRFFCLVREQDGNVIAALNLRFEDQLHHADRIAEIMEFAVDASCRNRGVGKDMLAQACRIAREHGCSQLEVACNQLRTDTHRFYAREGMHNFHYKFSRSLTGDDSAENTLGR